MMPIRAGVLSAAIVAAWSMTAAATVQSCPNAGSCVQVTVGTGSGKVGDTVTIPVSFAQSPTSDNQPGGPDEIAALVMTIDMAGANNTTPLVLADCTINANNLPNSVQPLISNFNVVVENATCDNGRTHCLCPANGSGITPDNFINLAVYGPNPLPTPGTGVQIPTIPSGMIMNIGLKIASGNGPVPLHVLNQVSDDPSSKPQFTALLSIGDTQAVDQTCVPMAGVPPCSGANAVSQVVVNDGSVTIMGQSCIGDCDGSGDVGITELITLVNIALGNSDISACTAGDANNDGMIEINEIITAVNNALNGCPA